MLLTSTNWHILIFSLSSHKRLIFPITTTFALTSCFVPICKLATKAFIDKCIIYLLLGFLFVFVYFVTLNSLQRLQGLIVVIV